MARLVVISPATAGGPYELGQAWATIGRADGNTFQIADVSVSGRHCEVRWRDGELVVRDLLSTNGTFAGGRKITEGVLRAGQTLRVGDVQLRFEASAVADPTHNFPAIVLGSAEAEAGTEKQFQVLLVDDSMAFLETFGELCSVLANHTWAIHTATGADQALTVLREKSVDLVVLDIRMPLVDGLQLLGLIRRRHPAVKVAVMTGNATEGWRTDALAGGAELFIEKPATPDSMRSVFNMLHDLVSWAQREGFSGALRQVSLPEVIQMECLSRHSSILEIRNTELRGQIYIEAGAVTHATVGTLTGEPAFYRVLALKGGEFQLRPFTPPPQRTVHSGWEHLLMDAARASDEETALLKRPAVTPAPPPVDKNDYSVRDDNLVVVATYDSDDAKWMPVDGANK